MYEKLLFYFMKCVNSEYHHTENNGSFALQREGKLLYVLFEKSNGRADWKSNLNFLPQKTDEPNAFCCHRGFLKVWESILPYIEKELSDKSIEKIIIIGYSHGGAIAALCHEYLYTERSDIQNNIFSYGFGAPRVYYGVKVLDYERWKNYTVVRNGNDLVTYLPPKFLFYRDLGTIIEIGKEFSFSPIEAHKRESYEKSLKANCNISFFGRKSRL